MLLTKGLVCVSFVPLVFPALRAEPHCPGNAASIRPRFVEHSMIIIPVKINHAGPYDFVVDTAEQVTAIDPSLAADQHLRLTGAANIIGAGFHTQASYGHLESIQVGASEVRDPLVASYNLGQIRVTDPRVRGVLGQNFLEHFDLFIDYAHGLLCIDETKQMQQSVKGEHIALMPPLHPERNLPFTQPLLISAHLSGIARPLLLQLDSGINAPLLFDTAKNQVQTPFASAVLHSRGSDGVVHAFAILPPQDIRVGVHAFHQVSFVTPVTPDNDASQKPEGDGVLPTILFRRVFVSYADHYAILDPW